MNDMRIESDHFMAGERKAGVGNATLQLYSPATGEAIAAAPIGTPDEVAAAVTDAEDGLRAWSAFSAEEKERVLFAMATAIDAHGERLAEMESLNTGKSMGIAREEIAGAASVIRFYAGYPTKHHGAQIPTSDPGTLCYTIREPIGVVGAITPWNYPLVIAAGKVAGALAAGCSVVVKPAPETPLTTIELAAIGVDAGLPPGALNVVVGDGSTGAALSSDPRVGKLTFTGSTATGRKVLLAAAANGRPAIMELGGKSPNIVFADVDLPAAIDKIVMGAFANGGQECCAGARVLVEGSAFEEFVELARERIGSLRCGATDDDEIGPLITERHLERVSGFVERALTDGAIVAGRGEIPEKGFFYPPTMLTNVTEEMEICRSEIFGPVLTVDRFEDEDDAIRMGNDTQYGLAAGIWTSSIGRSIRLARELDAGLVWVNSYLAGEAAAPFGGNKASGFGRELGLEGPEEFSQTKVVYVTAPPGS